MFYFWCPAGNPSERRLAAAAANMKQTTIEGRSDIQELRVSGDWAWMRCRLVVTVTSPQGESRKHSGYTLTILRKQSDGKWVVARDANLLTP
jgi:uncharacterized protein (TIGR02246 family)